jgi:hypothetical protein
MSLDPMSIFEMARRAREMPSELGPASYNSNPGFMMQEVKDAIDDTSGEVRSPSTGADLRGIPRAATDPRYRQRIPPPACMHCGQDHLSNKSYDHPLFTGGDEPVYPQQVDSPRLPHPAPLSSGQGAGRRVAIYVGRGDSFVVKVEENPPEWDDRWTVRCSLAEAVLIRNLCTALGVRAKDNTAGELDNAQLGQDSLVTAATPGAGWQNGPSRADVERAWQAAQPLAAGGGQPVVADGGGGSDPAGPADRAAGPTDLRQAG